MKSAPTRILTLLFAAAILAPVVLRAEVAVVEVRFGKEKEPKRIVIDLFEEAAPKTVENFVRLAKKGFYRGQAFHRAIPDYLVQVGDPLSERNDRSRVGTGGPGYTLPAEINRPAKRGSVAMGRLPDSINPARLSNGSQFFILLISAPDISGKYTVFGEVIEGLDVAEAISKEPADSNDYPNKRIEIRSVRIMDAAPPPPAPREEKKKKAESEER